MTLRGKRYREKANERMGREGWKKLDGWKQETSSIGKMTLAVGIPSSSIIILPRFPSDERKEDGVGWVRRGGGLESDENHG